MISTLRGSSPSGKGLNVTAVRSRIFSSTKLFVMASATAMCSLVPSAAYGQAAVAARPPISDEAMALHRLAKRPVAKSTATTPGDRQPYLGIRRGSTRHKVPELERAISEHLAATCFLRLRVSAQMYPFRTSGPRLPQSTRAWSAPCSCSTPGKSTPLPARLPSRCIRDRSRPPARRSGTS